MKIAVTYENEQVYEHFGHTEKFKIYEVENDNIVGMSIVDTNVGGHGALASFLKENGVDTVICGGIGGGAQNALTKAGIKFYGGVKGDCNSAVISLLLGKLQYNPDIKCDHHDHNHGENHNCDGHDCGGNCDR